VHYVAKKFELLANLSEAITGALSDWCIQLDQDVVAFVMDNGSNI